jgi:hypothetical protein
MAQCKKCTLTVLTTKITSKFPSSLSCKHAFLRIRYWDVGLLGFRTSYIVHYSKEHNVPETDPIAKMLFFRMLDVGEI